MSRRHYESIEINLIPYIDILLVLVLILMLSSALSYQTHDIQLPSTHGTVLDNEITDRHITLNVRNEVGLRIADQVSTLGLLGTLSPESFSSLDPALVYTIDADNSLSYQKIVDLLTLLKQSGFTKVALAMQS